VVPAGLNSPGVPSEANGLLAAPFSKGERIRIARRYPNLDSTQVLNPEGFGDVGKGQVGDVISCFAEGGRWRVAGELANSGMPRIRTNQGCFPHRFRGWCEPAIAWSRSDCSPMAHSVWEGCSYSWGRYTACEVYPASCRSVAEMRSAVNGQARLPVGISEYGCNRRILLKPWRMKAEHPRQWRAPCQVLRSR
jgi:hypothetical protein